MPSHPRHNQPSLCRNRLTRRPGLVVLLVLASPVVQTLVLGGTLTFSTGCGGPSVEDCEDDFALCVESCPQVGGEACKISCSQTFDLCLDDADATAARREDAAVALDVGLACVAATACVLDTGDGDGDGDGDPTPEPSPDDDWGEDWGEQLDDDAVELGAPPLDLPAP